MRGSAPARNDIATRVADAILGFVGEVPGSSTMPSNTPAEVARGVANSAAAKAGLTAGSLALPVGPIGWLTILPELVAVWRIQARMVADIAALYDQTASLTREHMLYCLFRHSAAQAVRDLVARAGERLLVNSVSLGALQGVARAIGVEITQHAIGRGVARWIPFAGAVGVGAYAYYDTARVASTAMEFFAQVVEVEVEAATGPVHGQGRAR
ncbi:MAG TPA: hypothetical protein VMG60_00280 [Burkholderiaceae bacterium]|nr:hypothetical protein [Burkholderiaceae bacterium]